MDSQKLAQEHPEVYMEFVSNADVVFKIPHSISIFWWTACVMWWVVVEQKIPLNCYVSIKKTNHWKITIGKYVRFNPNISEFEQLDADRFESPRTTFIDALQWQYPGASYELSILNEVPNKTPDAVAFLSVLALEYNENPDFSMERFCIEKKCAYESKFIRDLIRKTEFLRLRFNETTMGLSSMSAIYCALHDGMDTIIHRTEAQLPLPRKDEALAFSQSSTRRFSGTSIRKILWEIWKMPFEMIVLTPKTTEKNSHWYWELANNILWAEAIACEIDLATQTSGSWLSRKHSLAESMEMIVACSEMLTLNAINAIRKHHEWKVVESELFWLLNKAHEGSKHLLWKSNLENSKSEALLTYELKKNIDKHTSWEYLIFRTGSSIDMNYVILLSRKIPYEEMLSISEGLKCDSFKQFNVLFSTVTDKSTELDVKTVSAKELLGNTKNEGLEVRTVWAITWKYVGMWFLEFVSWQDGIVIDADSWRVYANWVRATSKEIPSQQFTTEVFLRLANSDQVKSCNLPLSTYSTSKNEIISKILNPFRKYVALHIWIDIEWLIDWSETDFQFKIKNIPGEEIVIVRRIFQD